MIFRKRSSICLLVLIVVVIILRGCPQVQVEQAPSRILLPLVFRNWNPRLAAMRGVAASGNGGVEAVRQTGASWYLNWSPYPTGGLPDNVEFVPEINAPIDLMPTAIADSEYLLELNEPERWGQGQTCPENYVPIAHEIETRWGDRKLVSPGVGQQGTLNCRAPNGEMRYAIDGMEWLTDFRIFYERQYGYYPKWDVLALHCYAPPESSCAFRTTIDAFVVLARSWGISQVVVSEFDAGKGGSQSVQRLRDAMAYWASVPEIMAIFYYQDWQFAAEVGNSPLMNERGELTEYGKAYRQ